METIILPNDIVVFGMKVKNFPAGIGEAFESLAKLPEGDERPFYGISSCNEKGITYTAATIEKYPEEAAKYGLERMVIEKGEYLSATIQGWQSKTGSIKGVFANLQKEPFADNSKPLIEFYKNMEQMQCLVKVDLLKKVITEFEKSVSDLTLVIDQFDEEQLNKKPFPESWSPLQVCEHLSKSYKGIYKILQGPTKQADKQPREIIDKIIHFFSDFTIKTEAPGFVIPAEQHYK
jgi:predicted transcriptional regulator YdeE